MPMDTQGKTTGAVLKADILASDRDLFRVGGEYQKYRLDDWWPAIGPISPMVNGHAGMAMSMNMMNGRLSGTSTTASATASTSSANGKRAGVGNGCRSWACAAAPCGWTPAMCRATTRVDYGNPANPNSIPGAFNAADRSRTDHNLDLTALLRFTPDAQQTYEAGFARKTRSPNLYERYAWSTNNTMAMTMINWFGDGNGYVGNLDLNPEVANTLSATASWHDAAREQWGFNCHSLLHLRARLHRRASLFRGQRCMSPCHRNNVTARQASSTSSSSINRLACTAPTFPATSRCSRAAPSAM
jgi:iron complex outermembrane receptor protein